MSPRTWGWTMKLCCFDSRAADVPTHVGVDLVVGADGDRRTGCPHARGGGPVIRSASRASPRMSPRTWGWTATTSPNGPTGRDVPTHVGVDRNNVTKWSYWTRCPHARGGGPGSPPPRTGHSPMSPRTWGWTVPDGVAKRLGADVPTHVGVDPWRCVRSTGSSRCPHARGGGPPLDHDVEGIAEMSPRTWGWTPCRDPARPHRRDVPTHVGVDPERGVQWLRDPGCPHARGGGPTTPDGTVYDSSMSPRTWGWTVQISPDESQFLDVPTHVGVDPAASPEHRPAHRCPHARGGGPSMPRITGLEPRMSPRTWGWTPGPVVGGPVSVDVPTHVGVDLSSGVRSGWWVRCPHARGGGPVSMPRGRRRNTMSPRTWGWTLIKLHFSEDACDVPTHVGVDRVARSHDHAESRCPHARGGGPPPILTRPHSTMMSPRTWGWTPEVGAADGVADDVPTHVGVDPCYGEIIRDRVGCPHARGGGPETPT